MKGAGLELWSLSVPVDFSIARARMLWSHHVLVRLAVNGQEGWGSAPLYARFPHALPRIRDELLLPLIPHVLSLDPREGRGVLRERLGSVPDVLSAVDGALWDLEGRMQRRSVASMLGARDFAVPITEQIFVLDEARALRELAQIESRGVRRLKVKLSGEPDADLRRVAAIRGAATDGLEIRVDANRGFTLSQALRVAPRLAELGVTEWEEPISGSFADLGRLRAQTTLRVILDEAVRSEDELERAIAAEALDVLNLKLGRLGGITAAARYRDACSGAGVGILLGCAEDLGPGMAAILHASAAWQPNATEGIGAARLGVDVARPTPVVSSGSVDVADRPGWGLDAVGAVDTLTSDSTSPARLVHESDWGARFRLRSWLGRQRQRAASVPLRLRRALGA